MYDNDITYKRINILIPDPLAKRGFKNLKFQVRSQTKPRALLLGQRCDVLAYVGILLSSNCKIALAVLKVMR